MEYRGIIGRIEDWYQRDLDEGRVTAHGVGIYSARFDIAQFLTKETKNANNSDN